MVAFEGELSSVLSPVLCVDVTRATCLGAMTSANKRAPLVEDQIVDGSQ